MNIKQINEIMSSFFEEAKSLDLKVWTHNGDFLLFETKIKDYAEYETEYFPHLQHVLVEIWDGDDLKHNIKLGYGS